MKIGLMINHFNFPRPAELLVNIAQSAEEAGFASLWVLDHFFQMERAEEPMLEAYSTLAYLAAVTHKIQLGVMVTGVIYRIPGILIKTVTTLDVLSKGRAWLGLGAAWYEREAHGLGIPFPPLAERFEWVEETLQIAKQMWSGHNGTYHGKHFHLTETLNSPAPISKPHPPILVGGSGEKKTLRLVAQYADACNFDMVMGDDSLRHKLRVLGEHCATIRRDYDTIEKTVVGHINLDRASPTQVIERCQQLGEMGFQHVIFNMPNAHELRPLETFGSEIIGGL